MRVDAVYPHHLPYTPPEFNLLLWLEDVQIWAIFIAFIFRLLSSTSCKAHNIISPCSSKMFPSHCFPHCGIWPNPSRCSPYVLSNLPIL